MKIFGDIDVMGSNNINHVSNMRLSYASGRLKLVGYDGNDLGDENPGNVTINYGTSTKKLTFTSSPLFDDDTAATSDFTSTYFHTTNGSDWTNAIPFFIYATYDTSNNPYIFISPCPNYQATPSSSALISYHNTAGGTQNQYSIFVWSSSVTPANLTSRPCIRIGAISMTKASTNDWTVVGYNTDGYGIGRFPYGIGYAFPTGRRGAATGTYFENNGGTAPIFTTNNYYYKIDEYGFVTLEIQLDGDGGTDGAGAVAALLDMPYDAYPDVTLYTPQVTTRIEFPSTLYFAYTFIQNIGSSRLRFNIPTVSGSSLQNTVTGVTLSQFSAGARSVFSGVRYKAF